MMSSNLHGTTLLDFSHYMYVKSFKINYLQLHLIHIYLESNPTDEGEINQIYLQLCCKSIRIHFNTIMNLIMMPLKFSKA